MNPRPGFLAHLRPRRVPARALEFRRTHALGGTACFLLLVQAGTGLLLLLAYVPGAELAHASVRRLEEAVMFGSLVRSLHHWSGHALPAVALCHLLRVLRDLAFAGPRQRTWHTGLGLGLVLLGANFTGYLLPGDQLAYWAGTVAVSLASCLVPGQALLPGPLLSGGPGTVDLLLAFKLHVAILPALLLVLAALHFHGIRRAGGIVPHGPAGPGSPVEPGQAGRADSQAGGKGAETVDAAGLFVRERAWAALLGAVLLLWSMAAPAPLGPAADPLHTPALLHAPWYFRGMQALLLLVPDPALAWLPPAALLAGLVLLPPCGQRWPRAGARLAQVLAAGLTAFILLGAAWPWLARPGGGAG